jgi:hypothetical protein
MLDLDPEKRLSPRKALRDEEYASIAVLSPENNDPQCATRVASWFRMKSVLKLVGSGISVAEAHKLKG